MDAREEMKRWIAVIVQNAGDEDSKAIKADIDMFLDASATLAGILSTKNQSLARKCRPKQPKAPKLAPAKPLQQRPGSASSAASSNGQMDAQDSENWSEGISRIRQGIEKARKSAKVQQQALRQQLYGKQNSDAAFQKAAKALAS